jgi:type VI secretion system secreted protein VgrG
MKPALFGHRNFCTYIAAALLVAVHPSTNFASILGSAETFAVLGGSTVTNSGPTVIDGDLGVTPGTAITGSPSVINGSIYTGADPVALQAHADAITAYNFVAAQPTGTNLSGQNLGGLTLTSGVYTFDTSAQLTGTLTLDTLGDPNAIFYFRIGTTFTTDALSSVVTVGLDGAPAPNIVWLVGTSATIGADTALEGTILAQTSISLGANASILGRALAIDGAVTMDSNNISNGLAAVPEPNNLYCGLFGIGLILAKLGRDVRMKKAS